MTEFRKFNSLENTYNKKFLEMIAFEPCYKEEWIATEKLHGANFSFWWDKVNGVRVANRSDFVDGSFYSCTNVINKHSANFAEFCEEHYPNSVVVVYGELIGGKVSPGIFYGEKRFAAFDVTIDGVVLKKDVALGSFALQAGFPIVPVIKFGTLQELLELSPEFVSKEAAVVGDRDSSEGFVFEPVIPTYLRSGKRVYLKHKSAAFKEKKDKPVHKPQVEVSEEGGELLELLTSRCTEARVSNVLSKLGELTNKQFGLLFGEFMLDVLDEFEREEGYHAKTAAGEEWKVINKLFTKEATQVVRTAFVAQL
jgi:Rnl2 family RNA ligase